MEKGEHHQKLPREAFMVIRNQIDIDCPWEEDDSARSPQFVEIINMHYVRSSTTVKTKAKWIWASINYAKSCKQRRGEEDGKTLLRWCVIIIMIYSTESRVYTLHGVVWGKLKAPAAGIMKHKSLRFERHTSRSSLPPPVSCVLASCAAEASTN